MTNVWFGDGLHGKATFTSCQLWQVCNISDPKAFEVVVFDSPHYGLVNVSATDAELQLPGDLASDNTAREKLASNVMSMDYRSVPARLELTKKD